ncbi:hypothetical protein GCM10009557_02220 [Virgisporangium ochraceum]|uniref:Uncharacterized protein n=1 Tax=Virgisporangium ochraceum TaxID=65505 RepID=A0A8J4EFP1_9ACTN|nr:hypothetical protein Voc01_077700 [Virgisporangium ochraceum]
MQRRLASEVDDPHVLTVLAHDGRIRKVRTVAAERLRRLSGRAATPDQSEPNSSKPQRRSPGHNLP